MLCSVIAIDNLKEQNYNYQKYRYQRSYSLTFSLNKRYKCIYSLIIKISNIGSDC